MAVAKEEESWQYNKTVLERNKYMLENQLATDVTFLVGESPARRIPAHQYVLISGSPVFYSMFCGDMRERGEVKVPDITPDTFTQMLRYLYYEEADITGESVMQILYGSKKYLIPGLTQKCTEFLENNLSGENVAAILEQCLLFDEKEMVSKCMNVIGEKTEEVLKSESFGKVSNETLVKILENDSCSVSEIDLFKGSVDWARRKISNKTPSGDMVRNTLGKALFNLRFPVMTSEELADEVGPTEILTKEEENICFRYLNTQKKKPTGIPFPTAPRVDNSCKYIHLKMDKKQGILNANTVSVIEFKIQNNSSNELSIIGFVPYGNITELRYYYPNDQFCKEVNFQTHSAGTCNHNQFETCVTFPILTIPVGLKCHIQMFSVRTYRDPIQGKMLTFTDNKCTINALVIGDKIPIQEILIDKSTILK